MRCVRSGVGVGAALLGVLFGQAAACSGNAFECTRSDQCTAGDGAGRCEDSGLCSFPDAACPSGRRYGEHGGELSGLCVPAQDIATTGAWSGGEQGGSGESGLGVEDESSGGAPMPADSTGADDSPASCDWWDASWQFRVRLVPTQLSGEQTFSNFVAPVRLDPTRLNYAQVQAGGADLRFVRDADDAVLPYEVERWDIQGESVVWVRWTSLTDDTDAVWMYFGNDGAAAASNGPEVFVEPTVFVTHMHAPLQDATANNAVSETDTVDGAGYLGTAREFDNDDSLVDGGNGPEVADVFANGGTVSAWIHPTGWGGANWGRIVDKSNGVNANQGWAFMVADDDDGRLEFRRDAGPHVLWSGPPSSVLLDQWQWAVVTFDDSNVEQDPTLYIDGVSMPLQRQGIPSQDGLSLDAEHNLTIGNRFDLHNRQFEGAIDEVRASRTIRSPQWVSTQYRAMTDTLLQYDAVQTRPADCGDSP